VIKIPDLTREIRDLVIYNAAAQLKEIHDAAARLKEKMA